MTALVSELPNEPWRRRLFLPAYMVNDAARYSGVSSKTVADWHRVGGRKAVTLSRREKRTQLSYMQLIEVAVVAAFRNAGLPLSAIRDAREYASRTLKSEFPFAEYQFKKEGKRLLIDYKQIDGKAGEGKFLDVTQGGQLVWEKFVSPKLQEFAYEAEGIVIRWHVAGLKSPVVIDPRISFGEPTVSGVPTWIIKGRWDAGENIDDIAKDFGMKKIDVRKTLAFEGVKPDLKRQPVWIN